jgi:hypothetical protein
MDINGYSYEGSIELVRSNNAWLAVNELEPGKLCGIGGGR